MFSNSLTTDNALILVSSDFGRMESVGPICLKIDLH